MKEDFTRDFKEDWRFEEALSIKGSKVEQNSRRHGRATGVHGHAPELETSVTNRHCAQPAVCGCTASYAPRASAHGRAGATLCAISQFSVFLSAIFWHFWWTS